MPEELDPATNLPKDPVKEAQQARQKIEDPPSDSEGPSLDARDMIKMSQEGTPTGVPQEVQGAFGEYPGVNVTSDRAFNELRAEGTSNWRMWGNALGQSAGTVVGMGLESVGYLADIPQAVASMVSDSEMKWERNVLADLGNEIEERSKEMFPVYQTEEAQSGGLERFAQGSFWASNAPSIASTLSLMVPAGAIGRGVGALTRAARAGLQTQRGAATVSAALGSRHMENMLEGYEVFEQNKQRAIDNGFNEVEANQIAGDQASDAYRRGYANLAMDMMEWGGLMRGANFASSRIKRSIAELGEESGDETMRAISRALKRNPNLDVKKAAEKAGFSWKDYLAQSGLEGYEEFNQSFIQRLSEHNADVAMGLTDKSEQSFGEAYTGALMGEHLQDPEAWNAAVLGSIGGALFQTAGMTEAFQGKSENNARMAKATQERAQYIKDTMDNINVALTEGDLDTAQKHREDLVLNMSLNGVRNANGEFVGSAMEGKLGHTKEMFQAVKNMNSSELETLGLDQSAKQEADWVLGEIDQIEETFNKYSNQTTGTENDSAIVGLLTSQDYKNQKSKEHINRIQGELDQAYNDESNIMESLESDQQQLVRLKNELDAKKKTYNDLVNAEDMQFGLLPFRKKINDSVRSQSLPKLKKEIQDISQRISNLIPKKQRNRFLELGDNLSDIEIQDLGQEEYDVDLDSEGINEVLNTVQQISGEGSDIQKRQQALEESKVESFEGQKTMNQLLKPETQKEFFDTISKSGEELQRIAKESFAKRKFGSGDYVQIGDNRYKVRHSGERTRQTYPSIMETMEGDEAIQRDPITQEPEVVDIEGIELQPVDENLNPTGDWQKPSAVENLDNVIEGTRIDADRVMTTEEFEQTSKDFDKAIENDDYTSAYDIVTEQLHKSNFSNQSRERAEQMLQGMQDHVSDMKSYGDIINFTKEVADNMDPVFANKVLPYARDRTAQLQNRYLAEIEVLDKAISKKKEKANKVAGRVEEINQEIDDIVPSIPEQGELFEGMAEQGEQRVEERSESAKQVNKLSNKISNTVDSLKSERSNIQEQSKQLDKDIKNLEKIKEDLSGAELPTVLLSDKIEEGKDEIQSMRTKLLTENDITSDQAQQLKQNYDDIQASVDKAVVAIEKFRSRVNEIDEAGNVLKAASDKAYNDLVEQGVLSGTESIYRDVDKQIFDQFRNKFNKYLTEEIKSRKKESPMFEEERVRQIVNENRLTETPENSVDQWVAMNKDFPTDSELFRSEDRQALQETRDALADIVEKQAEVEKYERLLGYIGKEINRRKATVKPKKLSTEREESGTEVLEWNNPKRTIYSVFKRPGGNSGSNFNPADQKSQRRYFRYVESTNFNSVPHELRIYQGSDLDNLDIIEGAKEAGYDTDEILVGVLTDTQGNFVDENGDTFSEFDAERALYTSMPLPSYDTLTDSEGKTFEPTERYLRENFEGKNTEQRRQAYERAKQKELDRYKRLREIWKEEIAEEGYTTRDILGKSMGVGNTIENAGMYDQGVEPNQLSDIFDNVDELEFEIVETNTFTHPVSGEVVYVPKGFVTVTNPKTGNLSEGALRRINDTEVRTILEGLRKYVRQSTIHDNGRINVDELEQNKAGELRDANGNKINKSIFETVQEYIYSFDDNASINFTDSDIPGGQIQIEGQVFDLFANNPDGEGKIKQVNPALIDHLQEFLPTKLYHVHNNKLKNNESYEKVEFSNGNFQTKSFDNYQQFLVDENVVGTWLSPTSDTGMNAYEDGVPSPEPEYQFFNQNVIFDNSLPREEQIDPSNTEGISSGSDLPINEDIYITPVRKGKNGVWKARRSQTDEGQTFEAELINAEELTPKQRDQAESVTVGDIAQNINKFKYAERNQEEMEEAPQPKEETEQFIDDRRDLIAKLRKQKESEQEEERKGARTPDVIANIKGAKKSLTKSSNNTPLSKREAQKIAKDLTQSTGIETILLNEEESVEFLNTLYREGRFNQKFSKDNIPYGIYLDGKAYIFDGGAIGAETLFHEVAHPIVSQIIEDNSLLANNLIEELENSYTGKGIIEEIREFYPEYVQENGQFDTNGWAEVITTAIGRSAAHENQRRRLDGFLTRMFRAIKQFFRDMFGDSVRIDNLDQNTTIQDLGNMLATSQEISVVPSLTTQYSKKTKPSLLQESRMTLPEKNVKFTQDAMNLVNFMFFDTLFFSYPDRVNSLFTQETNQQLRDDILTDIRNGLLDSSETIINNIEVLKDMSPEERSGYSITDLQDQANNMLYLVENFEDVVRLHNRYLERFHIEPITEETLETGEEKNSNRLWQAESIKFSTKQNATSAMRFLVGSLESNKTNDTFSIYPQKVDFGETFNLLSNKLAGTTTLAEKRKILEDLEGESGISDLMTRLFSKDVEDMGPEDIGTAMYLLQFNETFSKHYNDYKLVLNDEATTFKEINATINSGQRRLMREWQSNSYTNEDMFKTENGSYIYDTDYFNTKYAGDFDIIKDISLSSEQEVLVEDKAPHLRTRYRNYYKSLNFLEDLGVSITADVLPEKSLNFNNRVQHILNGIKKGEITDVFDKDGNASGDMEAISQHEITNSLDTTDNQHLNQDGETVHNVVLNHYISRIEDKINSVEHIEDLQRELPHLFNTSYTRNSLLLNRMSDKTTGAELFNENGERSKEFEVNVTEGVKDPKNNRGESFNELTFTDKVQLIMNEATNDSFSLFRAGDKKLERFINASFFSSSQINENAHLPVFTNYLVDELNYIREMKNRDSEYLGIQNALNNPFEETVLPKLLSQDSELKSIIEDVLDSGDISKVRNTEFKRKANKILTDYFDNQVDEIRDFLQDHMLIEKQGEIYKNNGIVGITENKEVGYNQKDLDNIIKKNVINRAIMNIEQTKLFTGHPAYYKGSDNFFHRMSGALGTKKTMAVGNEENKLIEKFFPSNNRMWADVDKNNNISVSDKYSEGAKPALRTAVFKDPEVTSRMISEIAAENIDTDIYKDMEESDAMGLVSIDTYRDMKIRAAEWGEALERLYQWETRDKRKNEIEVRNWTTGELETVTENDLKNNDGSRTVFTMLKPQYFGPMAEKGFVPGMYKLAVLPVLPSYTNYAMNKLRTYMNDNNVGLTTFETANKVGVKDPGQEVYNEKGLPDFSGVSTQDTFYDYWGLQLQTGNKMKDQVTLGSQYMKQILSGIYDKGEATTGKLGQLADQVGNTHNALIEEGKQELIDELGLQVENGQYTIGSIEKLTDFLQSEAYKRGANHNVIDSLAYLNDYIEGNVGLDILSNRDKVENILASIADSRVISQKVNGGAKVQAASTFFEESSRVMAGNTMNANELQFYEDGTLEVYMPHYFKEHFGDKNVSEISDKLLEAVGFRIPTSGLNVIERIKIKGFLPQSAGETIVLPSEIVAKAGSDFDVDKLNVLLPNYRIREGQPEYVQYFESIEEVTDFTEEIAEDLASRTGRTPKKSAIISELRDRGYDKIANIMENNIPNPSLRQMNSKEALQNRLIDLSSEIISQPESKKGLFTPIGIDILEDVKDDIEQLREDITGDVGYDDMLMDLKYYMKLTQRNIESIAGTGLAALHVSDHVHATRYDYMMSKNHDITLPHNETESGLVSLGSKYTSDGKNEIGNLLNQVTNMFIDGVKNPISFSLNLNLETAGPALYLMRAGVPVNHLFKFLNQPAIRDYVQYKAIRKSFANRGNDIMSKDQMMAKLSSKYGSTPADGEITMDKLDEGLSPKQTDKKFQRQILNEYMKYEESASVLSEYVNATRVDTVAMGKNTSQLDLMLNQLDSIASGSQLINSDKVLKQSENGYLAPHYKALQDFRAMFEPFFANLSREDAIDPYFELVDHVSDLDISMEDQVAILDKFKSDYIAAKVLNTPVNINGEMVQPIGGEVDNLMRGQNSLPKRILKMKKEGTDNLLINNLMPIIGKSEVNGRVIDNLKMVDQRLDEMEQNGIIESWRNLFSSNPQIARDLVKFTFLQNGLQLSPMTFTKFVPAEVYMETIHSAFSGPHEEMDTVQLLEQFIENNYNDENLVPTRWGQSTPDSPIWKEYELKDGVRPDDRKELRRKGINPYKPIPTIVTTKDFSIGIHGLFEGRRRFKPKAVKDFRNSRALLSYGEFETSSDVQEGEVQQLSDEMLNNLAREKNKSKQELDKNKNDCK